VAYKVQFGLVLQHTNKVAPMLSLVAEPIRVPERSEVEVSRIFLYSPLPTQGKVVPVSKTGVTSYGSADNYRSKVRMRINGIKNIRSWQGNEYGRAGKVAVYNRGRCQGLGV